MKSILRIVKWDKMFPVQSQRAEGGVLNKRMCVLQELGGQWEDAFLCALLGNDAMLEMSVGDLVAVNLRFQVRELNDGSGRVFQDCIVTDINKFGR